MKITYVLDTNVLVYDPESIFSFGKDNVALPVTVLEELDQFKGESSQRGFNSREVIRNLDALRERGSLRDGVQLDSGGNLRILFAPEDCSAPLLMQDVLDNQILYTAYCIKEKGHTVKFISKDINARVKSDVLGIPAFDYTKDKVASDRVYKGWVVAQVSANQLKKQKPEELVEIAKGEQLVPNEFILLQSRNNPYNAVLYRYLGEEEFKQVITPNLKWPFEPKNPQQLMALDLLLDPDIQLITLVGTAGTGKTFLALLAGLYKVLIEHEYEKILISRPVIPLGPDIGYLPGDIQEKLHSWMQPVHDNMEFISHAINQAVPHQMGIYRDESFHKPGRHYRRKRNGIREGGIPSLEELIKEKKVSLEAITYMRGRSIPFQFIIIDEVQNLTPHEVKTIISRAGEGSKIILAGDPYQIDSPYLDFSSNGLVIVTDKFKGQPIFGTVFLETSERSELSKLAGELL